MPIPKLRLEDALASVKQQGMPRMRDKRIVICSGVICSRRTTIKSLPREIISYVQSIRGLIFAGTSCTGGRLIDPRLSRRMG